MSPEQARRLLGVCLWARPCGQGSGRALELCWWEGLREGGCGEGLEPWVPAGLGHRCPILKRVCGGPELGRTGTRRGVVRLRRPRGPSHCTHNALCPSTPCLSLLLSLPVPVQVPFLPSWGPALVSGDRCPSPSGQQGKTDRLFLSVLPRPRQSHCPVCEGRPASERWLPAPGFRLQGSTVVFQGWRGA